MHASFSLLRHQRPMLNVIASIIFKAFAQNKNPVKEHRLSSERFNILPNPEIVESYHKWLGCHDRYSQQIAPHLFPNWTYPQLFSLGKKLHLPLHKVLNQGCKMVINSPIRLNSALSSRAEIYQIKNMDQKIRLSQRLITGTLEDSNALEAEIYAVILKNSKKILGRKKELSEIDTSKLNLLKILDITKEDAKSYAYLSGDVNPIHLSRNIARLMGLKGSIMHGFGLFAMIFETLQNQGFDISSIDVRFISPVYLGSKVQIFLQESSKPHHHSLRVISEDNKHLHLAGDFSYRSARV